MQYIRLLGTLLLACTLLQCGNTPKPVTDKDTWRDLNKNGKRDMYEDATQPIEARVNDLLAQMTLEEKAGQMFIGGAGMWEDGSLRGAANSKFFGPVRPTMPEDITQKHLSHFNYWQLPSMQTAAKGIYNAQKYAQDSTRLGIPLTFATDPRHAFSEAIFSLASKDLTAFPEQLGFGALNDAAAVRKFADIARQEYVAVGLRMALHPVADLATEPRWPRNAYTFGEDAEIAKKLTEAYVAGFQGEQLGATSVACMTKHWPGGGPQKDGLDPHFEFQQGQIYPGKNFEYHLIPFEGAFKSKTAAIMPYYGVPTDQTPENVGMSYNKYIITNLLRERFGYDGIVCTDWGLITDAPMGPNVVWKARAWGAEQLTEEQRVKKIIEAGCDQFGGESCPQHIVSLVKKGELTEQRIDQSVRRLLRLKFQLGLFDNPFPDTAQVAASLRKPEWVAFGDDMQRRSMTLLKNEANTLPIKQLKPRLFVQNVATETANQYGSVVNTLQDADIAIVRLQTPWVPYPHTDNPLAKGFHHGDLDFKDSLRNEVLRICKAKPTIIVLNLDRPAVLPEISSAARALIVEYGANDAAVLDVLFGKARPEGKLPFELPRSMQAVTRQKADLPHDSEQPLFPFGFGLKYE